MEYVDAAEVDAFINDDVFSKFDVDGDGGISFAEFAKAMSEINGNGSDDEQVETEEPETEPPVDLAGMQ